jgi:hypothetical protein
LFRSQSDYDDYLKNPYHSAKEKKYLIKLNVDFIQDVQENGVKGFNVTEIKSKPYSGVFMYQFKLEKIMDYGPNIIGVFGGENEGDVRVFRDELGRLIMMGRGERQQGGQQQQGGGQAQQQRQQQRQGGGGKKSGGYDFGSIGN